MIFNVFKCSLVQLVDTLYVGGSHMSPKTREFHYPIPIVKWNNEP